MQDLVSEERARVADLLATSGESFTEAERAQPLATAETLASWAFTSPGVAEIAIYVCDDTASIQAALNELNARAGAVSNYGLPAVGQNGRLVFIVRHLGTDDDTALFRTLGVVSAISGEEE